MGPGKDLLTPVPQFEHLAAPPEDELHCLVMNITVPPGSDQARYPVMCYIHGGSFLYGGSSRSVFDGVNLVTQSVQRDTPVVAVTFNYRVGLGGFLASESIRKDLERDGFEGAGNFGLTDQQLALQWIQAYISHFKGDRANVTIYGESAGGMSVSHQVVAKTPAPFHRAIAMSGSLNTIPTWPLDRHERHFRALCQYLKIDADANDALDQLRAVPQSSIAAATLPVEGVFVCTGNPCADGVFHARSPDVGDIQRPPGFLKSLMVGDVYDEAMIFRLSLAEDDFHSLQRGLRKFLGDIDTDFVLNLYEVSSDLTVDECRYRFERLAGDIVFVAQNWLTMHHAAKSASCKTYGYHFDQRSHLDNALNGLAYHALDLLYVFPNLYEEMSPQQIELSRAMVGAWIDFAYGKDPWETFDVGHRWMVFGPADKWGLKSEAEDEPVRKYSRMQKVVDRGILPALLAAVDNIVVKRERMGTFERSCN